MKKQYKNLGYFMLLMIPLTIAGFYKTYIGQYPDFSAKIDGYIHLHALIASVWIIMLIVQPILIRYKKYKTHRLIGKLSYIIFPLLILSFIPQMIKIADSVYLFQPLRDCILLFIFYGLAIYNRKNISLHMRYMIATALVFLFPTTGRIFHILFEMPRLVGTSATYLIIYGILISLAIYDKKNQKNYKPYLVTMVCMIASQIIFYVIFI